MESVQEQHKTQLAELQEMQRACMLCRDSEGKLPMKHASSEGKLPMKHATSAEDRPVQEDEHVGRDHHAHDRERVGLDVLWAMYYACSWYHCSVAIRTHFLHFAFKTLGSATRNGAMNTELVVVACLFDSCERRLR